MAAEHYQMRRSDSITVAEPVASGSNSAKDVEKGSSRAAVVDGNGKVAKTDVTVDAVWGDVTADGPNYRNLGWIRASVLETKTQIGLGVLGLPAVLDTLGMGPGLTLIFTVAVITTWSDYVIGIFKRNHPEVYTVADVGYIFFGPIGREIYGFLFWLMLTAIAGSGMLSFSIAINAVSEHGACTVIFVAVGAVIAFLVASIQTLDKISWIGWIGVGSIISAVITLAVAVGVSDRPSAAPQTGPFEIDVKASANPGFIDAMNAINIILFAFSGTPCFFNIVGEMRNVKDYTKSVLVCQTGVTTIYLVVGSVVYYYTGQYIATPALGSAGILMKKVCYGLAIPGLLVGCILNSHLPAKYVFVRILGGTRHLSKNTPTHYIVWFSVVACNCLLSFVIAESIPVFDDLLSIIGALLASFFCIITESMMYLYDTWKGERTRNWWMLTSLNVFLVLLGTFTMVAGTYTSVIQINDDLNVGATTNPFSCADNSHTV